MPKPVKWTIRIVLILVVVVVGLLVAGQYWIIPGMARSLISNGLGEVWEGDVEVGEVEFSYFGPIRIGGLGLKDAEQRQWLKIGPMTYGLGDWPSAGPKLRTVNVEGVTVRAHMVDGRVVWPIKKPPEKEEEPADFDKYLDIQEIVVDDISLGVMREGAEDIVWPTLKLTVKREGDQYRIDFGPKEAGASGAPKLTGTLDKSGPIDARFLWDKDFTPSEVGMLVALAGREYVRNASGRLQADVKLKGDAMDPTSVKPDGYVKLTNWSGTPMKGPEVTSLSADVGLEGRTINLKDFRADAAEGRLEAKGTVKLKDGGGFSYSVKGGSTNPFALPKLVNSVTGKDTFDRGAASAAFDLAGDEATPRPAGTITIAVQDADLYSPALLKQLFKGLGIQELRTISNADAAMEYRGNIITIQSASVGGGLTNVEIGEGSTVNLTNGKMDLVVVTVPTEKATGLASRVTGIDLVETVPQWLAKELSGFAVAGNYNDPGSITVLPKSLDDIRKLAPTIIGNTLKGGEEVGEAGKNVVEGLLKGILEAPAPEEE